MHVQLAGLHCLSHKHCLPGKIRLLDWCHDVKQGGKGGLGLLVCSPVDSADAK